MQSRPKVLIGYSTSGATRRLFEDGGCEAWTADLRPGEDRHHLQGDIWEALRSRQWDLVVLHPMCTYLTVSAAWAFGDGPYHQKVKPGTLVGADRRAARAAALSNFQRLLELPFPVAVENPARSFVCKAIRRPDQVVHPYMFGTDASKATGLWLRGVPELVLPAKEDWVQPRYINGLPRWGNQTDSGQSNAAPSEGRWLQRSAEVRAIGAAMAAQWAAWLTGADDA